MVGAGTLWATRTLHNDDGNLWRTVAYGAEDVAAGKVADSGVQNDAVDGRKALKGLNGFGAVVGGDHVELRGLDDQLAHGNGSGVFAIDYQEAGANHWLNGTR